MTLHSLYRIGRFGLLALTLFLLLPACSMTRVVDTWRTDETVTNKPDKVAVIAVLPDDLMRKAYEIDLANILTSRGTPAVPGSRIHGSPPLIPGILLPGTAGVPLLARIFAKSIS